MIERQVEIATADGSMTTFVLHPEEGGPFPVALYLMDAPSIRPALKDMASRLATVGYYVLLPYLYYRGGPYREFTASDEDMHARRELMAAVTRANVVRDAQALLTYADKDARAANGKAGAVGFCMSGPFALAIANAMPERIGAAASIHGAWFVTDKPDSTEKNVAAIRAEIYFAWPDNDPTAPREHRPILERALTSAGVRYTIDFFPDALHGFAPPGGPRHNRYAAEKHWERVFALFARTLH
jgi:carboxymethylenebutenolidase